MYCVLIKNVAKEGKSEEYAEASLRFAAEMRKLPGCLSFDVLRSDQDDSVIANLITWESREAAAADDGSVFLAFKPQLKPLLVSNTVETFEVL